MPRAFFWYNFIQNVEFLEGGVLSFLAVKSQVFLISIEENREFKQFFVHFILMIGLAFLFSKQLSKYISLKKGGINWLNLFITFLFILVFSFVIEIIQAFLPDSFTRGFDLMDIGVSLLGGLLGGVIGLITVQE